MIEYREAVATFSPGLPLPATLGFESHTRLNPEWGCVPIVAYTQRSRRGGNVGLEVVTALRYKTMRGA